MRRPVLRSLVGGAAGIAVGVLGGMGLTSVSAAGPTSEEASPPLVDATHVPPVLTLRGEPVRLRFGLVCTPRDDGLPCEGSGTVFLRRGQDGPFRPFALQLGEESKDGRYYLDVPAYIAESQAGFSYYAVLKDDETGASVSVPSGGADAPQASVPLRDPVAVPLGAHAFGAVREPDARAADAAWGSGGGDVGLEGSPDLGYTGPSSFDVEPDGTVDLLDSVNERVVRWLHGRHEQVMLGAGSAELADFAAEPHGNFDVLDLHDTLRRYRADGTQEWAQKLADRTWAKLDRGAVVLQEPSEEWMPVAGGATPLTRTQQRLAAQPAKQLANGHGLLVDRVGDGELRVAELRGGDQLRSWRITSETPLSEVQLAESHGNGIVLVTRVYTNARDEFVVLVLGGRGLVQRFSVASGSLTETAPLARFRFARGVLYRLRTTQSGASVDRFDLEVPQ